jgi:hypothetical protein
LIIALFSGCGTICNFADTENGPRIYGGVQKDVEILDGDKMPDKPLLSGSPNLHGAGASGAIAAGAILAIVLADPLVSFVADTLTLPITVPLQLRREAREKQDQAEAIPITVPAENPSPPESLPAPEPTIWKRSNMTNVGPDGFPRPRPEPLGPSGLAQDPLSPSIPERRRSSLP